MKDLLRNTWNKKSIKWYFFKLQSDVEDYLAKNGLTDLFALNLPTGSSSSTISSDSPLEELPSKVRFSAINIQY